MRFASRALSLAACAYFYSGSLVVAYVALSAATVVGDDNSNTLAIRIN